MSQDKFRLHPVQERFLKAKTENLYLRPFGSGVPFVKTDYSAIVNATKEAKRILGR